jgi:NAD(P)-dependent dehydrogenase (short-subunit alcohol dehydrogenase family)
VDVAGKVVVVTGGANGIGRALVQRFAAEGARGLVVADLDGDGARSVADAVAGSAVQCDVADAAQVQALISGAEAEFGPIDLFCANAGIAAEPDLNASPAAWQQAWDVNVMAHVHAAQALVPTMTERGEGYLLHTASAAGLLTNIGAAAYSVTKHAVVGLAEWLAVTYGDQGLKVSCLCPMGVRTDMLLGGADAAAGAVVLAQGAIEPDEVASVVVAGLADERFLILPHPEVAEFFRRKADDHDRWLSGMRRLQRSIIDGLE